MRPGCRISRTISQIQIITLSLSLSISSWFLRLDRSRGDIFFSSRTFNFISVKFSVFSNSLTCIIDENGYLSLLRCQVFYNFSFFFLLRNWNKETSYFEITSFVKILSRVLSGLRSNPNFSNIWSKVSEEVASFWWISFVLALLQKFQVFSKSKRDWISC